MKQLLKRNLQHELTDETSITKCAKEFGVIGDTTRLKICYLLCKHPELSVGEISEVLGMSMSAVSHALRKLKDAEVVASRKEAKYVYYQLSKSRLSDYIRKSL